MRPLRCCLLLLLLVRPVLATPEPFYVGTYTGASGSKGIYTGTLDSATGRMGPLTLLADAPDPSFLAVAPDGRTLYAAEENLGQVAAWQRSPGGSLTPLNQRVVQAKGGTCFVAVDASGRALLAANYGTGSVACFQLQDDGSIGARTAFVQVAGSGPNKDRQAGPHAHSIYASPDGAFAYSCDLGADRIWIYRFDAAAGTLVPSTPAAVAMRPGSGPRHLAFNREGKVLYVVSEMTHDVAVFSRDTFTGALVPIQLIAASTAPSAISVSSAEIALHPNGRWLFVSNRGSNTLAVFSVGAFGRLRRVEEVPAGVDGPRSFAIDPSGRWLLVAGQNDGRLRVFSVDPSSGRLGLTGEGGMLASPVHLLFQPLR